MPAPCDLLLTNAHILTMDERFTVHASGSVAITGGAILAVGTLAPAYEAAETVDCRGRVVMPGLVNAHTHAPMTLLRGLADDLRLDVWLMGYMMPVEREFVRPDFVALGTKLGLRRDDPVRARRASPTCTTSRSRSPKRRRRPGMRALCGQTVLKFPAPDAASFEDSLARAREFIARWKGASADRAGVGAARALHLHRGDPPRVRGAGARVRRAAAHASLRNGARSRDSRGANTACRSCRG